MALQDTYSIANIIDYTQLCRGGGSARHDLNLTVLHYPPSLFMRELLVSNEKQEA